MRNNTPLRNAMQQLARLSAIAAVIALTNFSSNDAQAQQQRAIGGCQGSACIAPPQQQSCCQPRLGFIGEMNCHGMLVVDVQPNSIACRMGLEPGDVILRINGHRVTSHANFQFLLREALVNHHGFVEMQVKNVRPYPPIATLHTRLVHTCGHGGGGGGVLHSHRSGF